MFAWYLQIPEKYYLQNIVYMEQLNTQDNCW